MNYKSVIFDMDGLLFDTEIVYYEATQVVADRFGFPYDKELYLKFLGVSDEEVWANYHRIFADFGKDTVQRFIKEAYNETIQRFSQGEVALIFWKNIKYQKLLPQVINGKSFSCFLKKIS